MSTNLGHSTPSESHRESHAWSDERLMAPRVRRPKGTGTIYWLASRGAWRAQVTRNGVKRTFHAATRERCAAKLAAAIANLPPAEPYAPKIRRRISPATRFRVLERSGFACVYCGAHAPDARLEIDHVIPVAAGGTDAEDNLVAACSVCNLGKGARR